MGTGGLLKEIPERGQLRQSDNKASAREAKIAALILAAGSSRRMGPENKLLADIDGKPLIHRVVEAVAKAKVSTLTIVTGHQAEKVSDALSSQTAKFVHNPDYKDGLATSLNVGIEALPDDIDGVVVCLGDMPLVTPENIDALIDAFDPVEGRAICIPVFGRKRGNPVLWAKSYLSEMSNIAGDVGARHLLEEHADQICEVMVDKDGVLYDIDTPERLAEFKNRH